MPLPTVTAEPLQGPTTVVVVDDHHAIRSALCLLLDSAPDLHVLGDATCVAQACRTIDAHAPDVVVLDLRLHGEDGLEVARHVRTEARPSRILVLSASESFTDLRAAMDAGAAGFLSKSATSQHLLDGIRRVAAGETVIGEELVYSLAGGR